LGDFRGCNGGAACPQNGVFCFPKTRLGRATF
jgi:hypothetical protein